ncbi:MAG: methionine--tRNA ligase subunit beta [Planctomycetes bacterium]|nr:methionine--tRNA ligase subunit beta [Planctomycetota bacterium]
MSESVSIQDFARLDLRVGQVVSVEAHPNANKLLVLKVNLGELGERQLVAGLKAHYEPEQLVGRKIVVIANLEPAVLRGVESQGMLLAASAGEQVIFLTPEKDIAPGAKVS